MGKQYNYKFDGKNSCIWLIIDHKLANEEIFIKEDASESKTITPMHTWQVILNSFPLSDSGKLQAPEFKLYPELQLVQTEESVAEHFMQLLAVHFLIVNLIMLLT